MSNKVLYIGLVVKETDKAVLVTIDDRRGKWVPKSKLVNYVDGDIQVCIAIKDNKWFNLKPYTRL